MTNKLYKKYQVTNYKAQSEINPLSFILRKAEIGYDLTNSEKIWLKKQGLLITEKIITNQESYRNRLHDEIRQEVLLLKKNKYLRVTTIPKVDSENAFALYKVHTQERLLSSEIHLARPEYHDFLDFNNRKKSLGITDEIPFDERVKNILIEIENKNSLCAENIKWIYDYNVYTFLTPLKEQFSYLQNKYKTNIQSDVNFDPLFILFILQKLDEKILPNQEEFKYLKTQGLTETLNIAKKIEFSILKKKYGAIQITDNNITHHLYKILKKLEEGLILPEQDINYLKKRKLFETIKFIYKKEVDSLNHKIKQGHGLTPDDIAWCEEHKFEEIIFRFWKGQYGISHNQNTLESPLYNILKNLEAGKRLNDNDVIWLEGEDLLRPKNIIYLEHHRLEALFNENEFQRTKDHWKLANASAQWRKVDKPERALKQTNNLNFKRIKPTKLTAALLTTRGGTLRDLGRLNEAEDCALEAIEYYDKSHNPYTLLGALCYQTKRYSDGDWWFAEAEKRGATIRDQNAEIKRILRKKKGQERTELIKHLLQKDPQRFAYLKNQR